MRMLLVGLLLCVAGQPAFGSDSDNPFDLRGLLARELPRTLYAGVGIGFVHHTGYVPNSRFNVEVWNAGTKAFAGGLLTDQIRFEAAYYYLGKAEFQQGAPIRSRETSQAIAAAALIYTPVLSRWGLPTPLPTRLFGRLGGAYKLINHRSVLGQFEETGLSYVLGGGLEMDLTSHVFLRLEYEYLSKIVSGTRRVIDVQHTPITFAVGGRF